MLYWAEAACRCLASARRDAEVSGESADALRLRIKAIEAAARAAIEANPNAVADYRAGKSSAINFLKGQVMKATRGKANPAVAEAALHSLLD